jgi:signal transduction histidine kinase
MRTTLVAIILWALVTITLCVVGILATGKALHRPDEHEGDPTKHLLIMLAEDVGASYESGGVPGLQAHLDQLRGRLPGEWFLIDSDGRDLVDGSARYAVSTVPGKGKFEMSGQPDGRLAAVIDVDEGRHRFVWLLEPWFRFPSPWPFVGVVVAINTAMASVLALYVSVPLRRLRRVMDRFGKGDLAARVGSRRSDELGIVSREFDLLADRVETLVTAERRLLRDVSHELGAPLTRLDLAIGLAMRRKEPGPFLERIRREQQRLAELVAELLHLTRVEGDPASRIRSTVRPAELLRTLVEECSIEAEENECRLVIESRFDGWIPGDPELLRRAIENVLRNAIRHAPAGSPVELSLSASATHVRIDVQDRGPGVPPAHLDEIFEPFFRVGDDRSRESGGVGLGLAIARRSIAIHGGEISARNGNPGLIVEVLLPVLVANDASPPPPTVRRSVDDA